MDVEEEESDNEPKEPERVSLADLKHRGKKKAIAPVNRTGPAIRSEHTSELNQYILTNVSVPFNIIG